MSVPSAARITSRQHAVVRRFREAARGGADRILLDGEHLIVDALDAGIPVDVLLTDGRAPALAARARKAGAEIYDAAPSVIDAASPVRTPSGLVALAVWRPVTPADVLQGSEAATLGLVGVQDPGNAGSAIRAADALGATGVLALDDTADPCNWKTLRGAMGSSFRIAVGRGTTTEAIAEARRLGIPIVATVASDGVPIDVAEFDRRPLVLVGSEGSGLPAAVVDASDVRVTIPMAPRVNSLNVSVTAAILLYELRRRHGARNRP